MGGLKVGDKAPDFALKSQDGEVVSLRDLTAKGSVVVYFYPKDFTRGCTTEAKAFTRSYPKFAELGAQVVGISSDSVESHRRFAGECSVPFRMLSDEGGKVRKSYGVPSSMGLFPGRVTYVIDRQGIIRRIFSSQIQAARHVEEALGGLRSNA